MRGQQPGQIHSKTSVTLSRPAVAWGESSEKCTGSFPLTQTHPGQGAELAVRRKQLLAGPFHSWSNFPPAAALRRRSETYHRILQRSAALWSSARRGSGRSCKLQVSDFGKLFLCSGSSVVSLGSGKSFPYNMRYSVSRTFPSCTTSLSKFFILVYLTFQSKP